MPASLVDIHMHILPGLDDGSDGWEASLEMARISAAEGVARVIATPHMMVGGPYAPSPQRVDELAAQLQRRLSEAGIPLEVQPGAEIYFTADVALRLERGEFLPLSPNGRYVLIDLPMAEVPRGLDQVVFELSVAGRIPIIAHPERNHGFLASPQLLWSLAEQGALFQVTAGSFTGRFGEQAQRLAQVMLEHRLVHVVASDAHSPQRRTPRLREACGVVAATAGEEVAEQLFATYPLRIARGELFEVPPPLPLEQTRRTKAQVQGRSRMPWWRRGLFGQRG